MSSQHDDRSLQIRLLSTSLVVDAHGTVSLPEAAVSLGPGTPMIWPLQVETTAEVLGDATREQASRIEQALKGAYQWPASLPPRGTPSLDPNTTAALTARPSAVGRLDRSVAVRLTVRVLFRRTGPGGRQEDRTEAATANLLLQPGAGAPAGTAARPCHLTLEPTAVVLRDGDVPAVLHVLLYNRPPDRPPQLLLRQRPEAAPGLREALDRLAETPFSGPHTDTATGAERWELELALDLPPQASEELKGLAVYEPLSLACQVTVRDAARADFLLRLAPRQTEFPGLLAIDLGTSSSTVTLYDPNVGLRNFAVPPEQEVQLQNRLLAELVDESGRCRLPGVSPGEWDELLTAVDLPGEGPGPMRLRAALQRGGPDLLEALRQIELHVAGLSIEEPVRDFLQDAYEEALLEPRLNSQRLIWVGLEPAPAGHKESKDIVSELEVLEAGTPLRVELGMGARKNRRAALTQVGAGGPVRSLADVRFKFHNSPKRYLGKQESFVGDVGGRPVMVTAQQVVQAAWMRLVELTNGWRQRNHDRVCRGPFSRVIVTYPTVAPPKVRREIETLVRQLGFSQVVTDYDEAVSAALFYFHRELGGSVDLGPELFKSCAQYDDRGHWFQNVLVLDIGGGSTDLALLRLTMEERPTAGTDRGAGGRYYVVTPRLLGSSGNRHLGGDLITLRVFELLKAILADRLLSAAQSGELTAAKSGDAAVDNLVARIRSLDKAFKEEEEEERRFRPGKIFEAVATLPEQNERRRSALHAAEQVLPTRWENQPQRSRSFYALWEQAENAKVQYLSRGESFRLGTEQIQELLTEFGYDLQLSPGVQVELTAAQFEQAAEEILKEAVQIARGLVRDRLGRSKGSGSEVLDWMILSGKTCNLGLVRRVLEREFGQPPAIRWNPDRVTFVPEYAKLATSVGACYAQMVRLIVPDVSKAEEILQGGRNQLRFQINNLFWFLPCSFLLVGLDGESEIFKAGEELFQLDESELGKTRSRVLGVQLLTTVSRRDFTNAPSIPWYQFDGTKLATAIGMTPASFESRMWMQFEVDHRLLMKLYLWEGRDRELPHHYQVDDKLSGLKLAQPSRTPDDGLPAEAWCDLAVAAETAMLANGEPLMLVRAGTPMRETFHLGDQEVRGLIVERLPDLFKDGKLVLYRRSPGEDRWQRVEEELSQPEEQSQSEFPVWYQLTLDATGMLRAHRGRVPYWRTTDPQAWKDNPEHVLEYELGLVVAPPPPARDPFNGAH
jgi:hypothetical protein